MGKRAWLAGASLSLWACSPSFGEWDKADTSTGAAPPPRTESPTVDTSAQPRVAASPFVLTESDPLSTFAADVDTASYDIFRRSLLNGRAIEPNEVRVEEYVNYFHYDYPPPKAGTQVPFAVDLVAGTPIAGQPTKILRVGLQGAVESQRRAANLVFLVDVSGSMLAENKLPLVQKTLRAALDVLAPSDTVSIVSYAAGTSVRLKPTEVREQSRIATVIGGLNAGGGTDGASGIELAYAQAEAALREDGINHVILCTDGDFNLGVTDNDALVQLIERKRKSGVTLTALGVGERNNDAMMERVSNAGNGNYSVLYNEDQALSYAHQRLLATMVHIAKDVKIQVEFNPAHVYAYRLIGYEDRALEDQQFRDDRVDAGEVGSGHQVTALYELALGAQDLPRGTYASDLRASVPEEGNEIDPGDLVRVRLRWKKPGASEQDAASEALFGLARDALLEEPDELDGDTLWAFAVASLAERLRQSPYLVGVNLNALGDQLATLVGTSPERAELLSLWPKALQRSNR
jgi:Ca-activated chloride channel family protein